MRRNGLVFKEIPEKMEGISDSWDTVEKLIMNNLHNYLKMNIETIHFEQAHRSPSQYIASQQGKPQPRPINVASSAWKSATTVLSSATMLKDKPLLIEEDGNIKYVSIYIEQVYSPMVSKKRAEMLRKRWKLKQKYPYWEMFLLYPTKLMRRVENGPAIQIPASVIQEAEE